MKCKLCGSPDVNTIYKGPIRSGGAESGYEDGFTVKECGACGIAFLDPFPNELRNYYETEDYWRSHHGPIEIRKLQQKLGPEQLRWAYEIGTERLRDKRIADFGCGAGLFLDLIGGIAAETIGVDLARHFQPHLEANGHRYIQNANDLGDESIDVAVSFDTLEHLMNPKQFLDAIFAAMVPRGIFFLGVPNQNDFLKELVPAYLPFFYHKSHLFYFSATTLINLLEEIGFQHCTVRYVHKYDIMNLISWARDGKGTGKKGSDLFDQFTEDAFQTNIERQGIASHIFVEAYK
jgi:2-polyprenyl-3-methyl-5-hydroxy-6-metoxy-1,4-benzoquinol methylase